MRIRSMGIKRHHFVSFFLLSGSLFAQNTSFSISNLSVPAAGGNQTYTTTITGTGPGTAVATGLASNVATVTNFSLVATRERGLNCGGIVQATATFSFNPTDSFTIFVTGAPGLLNSGTGSFVIISGTGIYTGRSGSGQFSVTLNQTGAGVGTITGGGNGSLSTTPPVALPSISPSGIVPVYSTVPIVQVGSWISIYGSNLATGTTVWNGDFPTTLGNTSVTVDGKAAYLWFVSPGQINLQVPNTTTAGCVKVVVTTPNGGVTSNVTLQPASPSFSLLDTKHVVGTIAVPDGSGAYGSGANSYDIVGPTGAFAFKTRPVKVGESLVLYGVGFGPTDTAVPAGQVYSGDSPTTKVPEVRIGGVQAKVDFAGIVGAGLYQINIVVPSVPSGDQVIQATLPLQPLLFSSNATQNCTDPDPEGAAPTNCAVYVTVQ